MELTLYKEKNFQETAIGKIPKDWKVAKVEEVCKVVGGGTPSTNVKEYWSGKIPFVTPTDVTKLEERNVNFLSTTASCITEEGLKNSSANLLQPGSVLLTSRATIGYCVINKVPVATNQGFVNLTCYEKVHNMYILYLMRFKRKMLEQLASGSTFKEIARTIVRNLSIQLPPLREQEKIAEVLSTVDQAIQKTNEVIAKTERLKKGLMQELLTKGIGHMEFKDTEIGRIPKEWKVVRVNEVCETITVGIVVKPASYYVSKGIPALRSLNIKEDRIDLQDLVFISESDNNSKLVKSRLKEGDVLVVRTGYPGTACVVPKELDGANCIDLVIARPNRKKIQSKFLSRVFNSHIGRKQCLAVQTGLAQKHFNINAVKKISIPLPPLEEQQNIAEILSTVDEKLEIERNEKARLERIKQGLMDSLLTGKIRIKVN